MKSFSAILCLVIAITAVAGPAVATPVEEEKAGAATPNNPNTEGDGKSTDESERSTPTKAAAERNENVFVSRLDTEAMKSDGARIGSNYSFVTLPLIETNYYAAEHGQPASEIMGINRKAAIPTGWHGELFESHRNSIFNARTFFQVGSVMPSRLNNYGARAGGTVPGMGQFSGDFSQRKVRGMVNGNCIFRLIVDTRSNRSWTVIPIDRGQRFRRDRGHFFPMIGIGVHDRGISVHDVGIAA